MEQTGQSIATAVNCVLIDDLDYYPSGVTAVGIASTLICSAWTDRSTIRWPVLVYMSLACITASICILVWNSPIGLKFFAYCMPCATPLPCVRFDSHFQILPVHHMLDRQPLSRLSSETSHMLFDITDGLQGGLTRYVPMTIKNAGSYLPP